MVGFSPQKFPKPESCSLAFSSPCLGPLGSQPCLLVQTSLPDCVWGSGYLGTGLRDLHFNHYWSLRLETPLARVSLDVSPLPGPGSSPVCNWFGQCPCASLRQGQRTVARRPDAPKRPSCRGSLATSGSVQRPPGGQHGSGSLWHGTEELILLCTSDPKTRPVSLSGTRLQLHHL